MKDLTQLAKEFGLYSEAKTEPEFAFPKRFLQLQYGEWIRRELRLRNRETNVPLVFQVREKGGLI